MKTDKIKIVDLVIYPGRNLYSHRPIMKLIIDIGKYSEIPTKDIPGFHERLLNAFPGLKTNTCSLGYPGGFLERLNTGTYLGHVIEHVILEMQFMLGYDVRYGKTRLLQEPSVYYLAYEFENEVCGLECGKAAVFILNYFLNEEDLDVTEFLDYLKKVSLEAELGPSTSAIVQEAVKRQIPVTRIGHESLVRLGYGKHSRLIESTLTDATSCISADISCNKQLTKAILTEHHVPVPFGKVVYSEISAVIAARHIGFPVVIKPFDGNQGKGVSLNLNSVAEVKQAFKEACRYSSGIIVEKFVDGRDYRILVVGNKVSAVSERLPALVTGDGVHTVGQLVDMVNQDEKRGEHHEKPLTKIKIDSVALSVLEKSGMTQESVPELGQVVKLRTNGNLSTGGTAVDRTCQIHPENAELAIRAAKAIGVDIAGIDMVTDDISQSIEETGGVVVEVNAAPGIRMHLYPSEGEAQNVASHIVDHLFPDPATYSFPIVSVTGTNGKTTTVRLISHVLSMTGKTVGMTSTSGTYIDGKCFLKGDNSGPRSARTLLANKSIDCAVLETARGGILREGLGYDLADVGIVLNVAEDHLGMEGIDTLEDLAHVKSLVTEAVKENGWAVFNADDAMTPYLMERARVNCILFSLSGPIAAFRGPKDKRVVRVYCSGGNIKLSDGGRAKKVISIEDVPITSGGKIACNIENTLAAVAALYGLGLPLKAIASGLKTFHSNAGRFNIHQVGKFRVMLDYGHNLPGYEQVVKACRELGYTRLVGIVGMPGNRMDAAIEAVGSFCSQAFDVVYIKEDKDRRGRERGEVPEMLYRAVAGNASPEKHAEIIEDELEALKKAVAAAQEGDLIVLFYEELAPLQEYLESLRFIYPSPQSSGTRPRTGEHSDTIKPEALMPDYTEAPRISSPSI